MRNGSVLKVRVAHTTDSILVGPSVLPVAGEVPVWFAGAVFQCHHPDLICHLTVCSSFVSIVPFTYVY